MFDKDGHKIAHKKWIQSQTDSHIKILKNKIVQNAALIYKTHWETKINGKVREWGASRRNWSTH